MLRSTIDYLPGKRQAQHPHNVECLRWCHMRGHFGNSHVRRRGVITWQAIWLVTKHVHTIPLAARSGQLSHLTVSSAVPLAQGD